METKAQVIERLHAGVIFLLETWKKPNETLHVNRYQWYGSNRLHSNRKQPRGSGGIGFLVKDCIRDSYDVDVIYMDKDGIMAISLSRKKSSFNILCL